MEDRRILIAIIIVLVCIPIQGTAYSNYNVGGHPLINKFAVQYFEEEILRNDPLLVGTSIRGEPTSGYAWDDIDGSVDIGPRNTVSMNRNKLVHHWIEDGGYSADEPEYTMALVHFYDPVNHPPYLTDSRFLQEFGEFLDADFANPQRSAVDWAFDRDLGYGYFIQDYSWNDALRYYKDALAYPSRANYNYGQAWRAVGETMHLVSDMTVPAHVRNDGHSWSDPYEDSVGSREVYYYKDGPFLNLNYNQGTLRDLMIHIATATNKNFYSADTTPIHYTTLKGEKYIYDFYPQPSLDGLTPDAQGYYYSEGGRVLAREDSTLFQPLLSSGVLTSVYRVDEKVLNAQRSVLIPTAIRASAEVLDRFLPRFEAKLSIRKYLPEDPEDDQYEVYTTLKQVHTEPDAWSGYDLIVRNGAYMVETPPGGTPTEKPLSLTPVWAAPPPDPNFNNWGDLYKFKPGTKVQMKYDLGGYVITSNEVVIPERPTPTPTKPTTTPTTYETREIITSTPTPARDVPVCGPGGSCELCCEWFMDEDPDINRIVCTPPWESGIDVGNKYDAGCWQVRAVCSCETGEDVKLNRYEYPNPMELAAQYYKNGGGVEEGGGTYTVREHSGESGYFYGNIS